MLIRLHYVKAYVRNCSNLHPYDCIWTLDVGQNWCGSYCVGIVYRQRLCAEPLGTVSVPSWLSSQFF